MWIEREDITKILIENGSDVTTKNKYKSTPLHEACFNGFIDTVKTLLKKDVEIDGKEHWGYTPFHISVLLGRYNIVKLLLNTKQVDIHTTNKKGDSLLHTSISSFHRPEHNLNRMNIIRLLLKNGVNINTKNKKGQTPLTKLKTSHYINPDGNYIHDKLYRFLIDNGGKE